jgi:predicted sulfurtransferase
MTTTTISKNGTTQTILPQNARAVCGKELPPLKHEHRYDGSILLFYQYIEEPVWTKAEHKAALKKVIEIGTKFDITGRGRVAQEGLNCTLTGRPNDIRSFCYALREWKDVFNETDFKITDGIPVDKMFKSLSIRKASELVAYGLSGGKCDIHCVGCFRLCERACMYAYLLSMGMRIQELRSATIKPDVD